MLGQEPRQTTSNVGHLNKPSIQALIHGLNRHYYSIAVGYLKGRGGGSGASQSTLGQGATTAGGVGGEEGMLMNLHKSVWTEALTMADFKSEGTRNLDKLKRLVTLAEGYEKRVKEETELSKEQLRTRYVGKVDPKKREYPSYIPSCRALLTYPLADIETVGMELIEDNIVSVSRQMIDKEASVPATRSDVDGANGAAESMAVDVDEDM